MGEGNADAVKKKRTAGEEGGGGDDEQQAVSGKQKNKKNGGGGGGGGGEEGNKKASAPVVLRVDLHCDGCARKVKKAIKAAQGVEGVATDMAASTVTVSGKPDPWDLKDRIESRTHKAVAFLSPPNPPKKNKDNSTSADGKRPAAAAAGKGNSDGKSKTTDEKKNKEPPETTVVVKIRLHCNGCIDRIKRTATKIKGVKQVTVDTAKEHVTVKGTMDAKALPDVLRDKLRREVAVVPSPARKDGGDGDKKKKKQQQQGGDEEDKDGEPQQQHAGGSGKKKNKNKQQQDGDGDGDGEEGGDAALGSMSAAAVAMMYGGGSSYRVEMLHAPQLFSDENPNACALM